MGSITIPVLTLNSWADLQTFYFRLFHFSHKVDIGGKFGEGSNYSFT